MPVASFANNFSHSEGCLVYRFLCCAKYIYIHIFLRYAGLSLPRPLRLRSTGSGRAGSAAMAHGPSRSAARGILPDRGMNPRPLHRQADSQPLRHRESPSMCLFNVFFYCLTPPLPPQYNFMRAVTFHEGRRLRIVAQSRGWQTCFVKG